MCKKRFGTSFVVWLILSSVMLFCGQVFAQNATLSGTITDGKTGEMLPGANILLMATGTTKQAAGAASDMSGKYKIQDIAAGSYDLIVQFVGYKTERRTVTLAAGEQQTIDLALTQTTIEFEALVTTASRQEEKVLDAPASVSVIEPREIEQEVTLSTSAVLRNTTGVDAAATGIDRQEIVLRGFNNAFSGATYTLTDYRQAAVPSLGVNIYSIMPSNSVDLERIEIVRGPGSALYGAGVDAGVIHFFTKDPFRYPSTTIAVAGGERNAMTVDFRHAQSIGSNFGYKVTGSFGQANDWKLNPSDPLDKAQLNNDKAGKTRNYDYQKLNVNGLMQYRFSNNSTLTANGGYSKLDAVVLSGIGTVQAEGFGYLYGQLRFQSGRFFAQAYLNRNNAGDSFVYGTGDAVVDKSMLYNGQAQYDFSMANGKEQIIMGVDYELTRPNTNGTILGRNENDDKINEAGAYVQSLTRVSPKLDLTLAARGDYNNIVDKIQFSPRAALVIKATPEHSFRASFNRAFSSPGTNSNFLDIVAREADAALPITIRGRGAAKGFTFEHNAAYTAFAGTDLVATSLNPASLGAAQPVGLPLASVYASVYGALSQIPTTTLQALLAQQGINLTEQQVGGLVALLGPSGGTNVQGFSKGVLGLLNPTTGQVNPVSGVTDVKPLKQTTSQTFELGYKGLINQRILFAIDGYYTTKKDFVGPLGMETPFVLVPTLSTDLQTALTAGIQGNAQLAGTLAALGIPAQQVAGIITALAAQSLPTAATPVAIVQPKENNSGPGTAPELLLTYRNYGSIKFWGIDASLQILASDQLSFFGNVSYVSDDYFDNKELKETGTSLELALNAPKFKAKGGFSYTVPKGISFNVAGRYTDGFPVRSGPYVGDVESYFLLDAGAGFDLAKYTPGLRVDLTVQNVLDDRHREFIGAPKLGRLAMLRANYTF